MSAPDVRDPFAELLGDGRGSPGTQPEASPGTQPEAAISLGDLTSTEILLSETLLAGGWQRSLSTAGRAWWTKLGHARCDAAGNEVGVSMTLAEAVASHIEGERLEAAGWRRRSDGSWHHPDPVGDGSVIDYVCEHARQAGLCQVGFEHRRENEKR